jgi:hypothetical protein
MQHQFNVQQLYALLTLYLCVLYLSENQCIREKTGAHNIVMEIKQYRKNGYNTYREWTQTVFLNKHYNINQTDEDT